MPQKNKAARRWIASAIAAAAEPLPSMPWAHKAARNPDQLIERTAIIAQSVVYPRRAILLAH